MRKGCGTVVFAIIGLVIIGAVISAATHKSNSGPTRSPALVTGNTGPSSSSSTGSNTGAGSTGNTGSAGSTGNTGSSSAPPAKPQTFRGNGSENIGTINVPTQSTLHWSCGTCAHNNFVLGNSFNDSSQLDVNALGPASGQTVVDAGTYHDVEVTTEGQAWTIRIVPGT